MIVAWIPDECTAHHDSAPTRNRSAGLVRRRTEPAEGGDARQAGEQPEQVEPVGEDRGDDDDPAEVVRDREREQERAQRRREASAEGGHDGHGERDVGRRGHRPTLRFAVGQRVDEKVDRRRRRHPADGGDDGQSRPSRGAQLADGELALELETDDEEEEGEQPVRGPGREGEVEAELGRTHEGVGDRVVRLRPGGAGPHERDDTGDEQEQGTDVLGPKGVEEVSLSTLRQRPEEGPAVAVAPAGHHPSPTWSR